MYVLPCRSDTHSKAYTTKLRRTYCNVCAHLIILRYFIYFGFLALNWWCSAPPMLNISAFYPWVDGARKPRFFEKIPDSRLPTPIFGQYVYCSHFCPLNITDSNGFCVMIWIGTQITQIDVIGMVYILFDILILIGSFRPECGNSLTARQNRECKACKACGEMAVISTIR